MQVENIKVNNSVQNFKSRTFSKGMQSIIEKQTGLTLNELRVRPHSEHNYPLSFDYNTLDLMPRNIYQYKGLVQTRDAINMEFDKLFKEPVHKRIITWIQNKVRIL